MKMKVTYIALMACLLGCGQASNPIQFSKIEPPVIEAVKKPTLLELYLNEKIGPEYMMTWFFNSYKEYRYKLFFIKNEIRLKMPLSDHDEDRLLVLEYQMNNAIRGFNDRNIFRRSKDVISAALDTPELKREKNKKDEKENPEDLVGLRGNEASPKVISDSIYGFLGSFVKYGFKIEEVNFFDR